MEKIKIYYWVAFLLIATSCMKQEPEATSVPNIILIMSDDQGWGDTGYNGHPHLKTPALDAMAANGVVFNRFYAASAVCSPTRGSVMTGRHPNRYGICNANCGHIPDQELTLAELVKESGYRTGHFGKWHLGTLTRDTLDANRGGRPENHQHYAPPWEHGFDVCFSTESKVPTWDPMIVPAKSAGDVKPEFIEGNHFGTYYWTGPGRIETKNLRGDNSRIIMDRVIPFIEDATENAQPFLSVIWFHSPHLPVLTGQKYAEQYPELSEDQQQYYGTVTAMDEQIGRLRLRLRELNIEKTTVLFFTSDNGPEGKTVGGRTQGTTKGLMGRKRSLHEGGIRVPGIAEWPGTINTMVTDVPCYTSDYLPTIAKLLNLNPSELSRPMDGIDIMPIMHGKKKERLDPMLFALRNQMALIQGDYKLYSNDEGENFKLYDLKNDQQESTDISSSNSELAIDLEKKYREWEKSIQASMHGVDY